ncbi:MAG: Xaa-Pro peptidase family protein [Synergistaceae bacterium]|jgi:Xaa-Pro aminopeptidase|nr:Xaa-Pro peptidase family protein [Synergistaceae bacterium]
MTDRQARLNEALLASGIDAILLTKRVNQMYIEGFPGEDCYMIASSRGNFLIADSRYTELGASTCRSAEIVPHRFPHPPLGDVIARVARERGFSRVGFERDDMTWGEHEDISGKLSEYGVGMVPVSSLVEGIRAKKDDFEIEKISNACRIADAALEDLTRCIKPGASELEIKTELDYRLKRHGAEDVSFDTMVLFGARASQPHANSRRDVELRVGDFILIDYGAEREGYRSDTTRTFVCGRASERQRNVYETVLKSQIESLAMVAPGANGRDINERARSIIRDAGYRTFEHGIGHGIGLEIHEEPSLRQNSDAALEPGMVITIEPGSYEPGWGGIRIEDTVLVTESGHRVLTSFPKELIVL